MVARLYQRVVPISVRAPKFGILRIDECVEIAGWLSVELIQTFRLRGGRPMSTRGEYAWHPPGIYKVVYARQDGAHIGPTHPTLEEMRQCTAPCERRINLRAIRTIHEIGRAHV